MLPAEDSQLVPAQIERLLQPGLRRLSFPAALELRFERSQRLQRAQRLWREGLVSIIVFNLFYLGEWLITRQITLGDLTVQMGVITPLCLTVNLLMRFNPPRWLREGSVAVMSCAISCTYLYLQQGKTPVAVAFALVGVIVTAMFSATVMRLRFRFALSVSSVIVTAGMVFLAHDHMLAAQEKITGAALMTIAIGTSMMSNYSLEREERLGYLRFLESESQRQEVSRMNRQLATLSAIDKLTGLPNRRTYEERFERIWAESAQDGTPVSLLVIDVDHFKVLNDVHGHTYGDEVLRRVGSLLPQALRSTADLAARYGGEEFVVILPHTDRESAERVAERIRALIEMAGSPPQPTMPKSECLMWVTASCGICTAMASAAERKENLLESADMAMYQAKSNGRNRVCFRELGAASPVETRVAVTGYVA